MGVALLINNFMVLYKQLTLTGLSLINNGVERLMDEKLEWVDTGHIVPGSGGAHVYLSDDIQNTLSSELLDQLQSIDLTPAVIVNFSEHGKTYETPVHNDLTLYNNNWVPMPFGINWELAAGITMFNWYNNKGHLYIAPSYKDETTAWPRSMLNGTRYHPKYLRDFEKIDSVRLLPNTAYLVRTDMPHQVVSESLGGLRIALSMRFPLDQVGSWEQALEVFRPFYAD
jgi:hypothetical protein